jgi:hypothetical protein
MYRTHPEAPIIVTVAKNQVRGVVPSTGQVVWTFVGGKISSNDVARIIVTDQHIFILGGGLACLRYPTGEIVWRNDQGPNGGSFILQDDRLIVAWSSRHYGYSAADGRLLWEMDGPGNHSAVGAPWNVAQGDRTE